MTGFFENAKNEYVITDMRPRRPLENYLWNEDFLANINHFGFGSSFLRLPGNERRQLFTETEATRLVYIKDRDTTEFYDTNRNYQNKSFDKYECCVGIGYQKIVSEYKNIATEYIITVPTCGNAELWQIRVKNTGETVRNLCVVSYSRPDANVTQHWAYGHADFEQELGGLYFCHDAFAVSHSYSGIYVKADISPDSYDTTDIYFKGYNEWGNPEGLYHEQLSNKGISFDNHYCAALQFDITLHPGEEKVINIVVGIATSIDNAKELSEQYLQKGFFEESINEIKRESEQSNHVFSANTPDDYINNLVNVWLKRQISLGKTWGRVYSKGFRDIMQDVAAFVSFDTDMAKKKIINCLEHQRYNGNPLRAFEPINSEPYHDGAVWIPATVLAYINESGDITILDEKCKYYDSDNEETVLEHMLKGLDFLISNRGKRNMVLWGGGDWNDSINNVGYQMKGESAWLSIATVKAITECCEILSLAGDHDDLYQKLEKEKEALRNAIIENAFEGDRFIYGINDWDEKLGSEDCEEGKIYLNPQTWAVLADILDVEKSNLIMQTVEKRLKCDYGYVQSAPAFSKKNEHVGRMAYFIPGGYENGSVYNHGVAFKIAADCKLGRNDAAYETLNLIRYDNPANSNSGAEPYAVSNMYLGPQEKFRPGFAPCSWITGTAGWLYRNITESIIGITAQYNGLKINPCLPSCWDHVEVSRIYRGATYNISVKRTGKFSVSVDGVKYDGDLLPVFEKNTVHTIAVEV